MTVDIITAAFNPGECLKQTLQSVRNQTFKDWKWWIVDDGSSENLEWIGDVDARIHYCRQENAGPSAARNRGILQSSSEFVAFLDADDLWRPDKLQKQIGILVADASIDLVYTAFDCVDEAGGRIGPGFGSAIQGYEDLLKKSVVLTSTVMLRRSRLPGVGLFDEKIRGPEDYDFFLRYLRSNKSFFVGDILASYRTSASSLSSATRPMFEQTMLVLRRHRRRAMREGRMEAARCAREGMRRQRISYACARFEAARRDFKSGRFWESLSGVVSSFWNAPLLISSSLGGFIRNKLG